MCFSARNNARYPDNIRTKIRRALPLFIIFDYHYLSINIITACQDSIPKTIHKNSSDSVFYYFALEKAFFSGVRSTFIEMYMYHISASITTLLHYYVNLPNEPPITGVPPTYHPTTSCTPLLTTSNLPLPPQSTLLVVKMWSSSLFLNEVTVPDFWKHSLFMIFRNSFRCTCVDLLCGYKLLLIYNASELIHFCAGGSDSLGALPAPVCLASVATIQTGGPPPTTAIPYMTHPYLACPPVIPTALPANVPVTSTSDGMILSPALDCIPQRLVQRIQGVHFLEMRELLSDNISLHEQLEAVHAQGNLAPYPAALQTRQREVPSLISWLYCFTTYIAVRTPDQLTRDMLAYCRLITREALRHGGQGWQEYDTTFRRQMEIDPSLSWNTLLPYLQVSTILGQRQGGGTFCPFCRGSDHVNQQCALASLLQRLPANFIYFILLTCRPKVPVPREGKERRLL